MPKKSKQKTKCKFLLKAFELVFVCENAENSTKQCWSFSWKFEVRSWKKQRKSHSFSFYFFIFIQLKQQ